MSKQRRGGGRQQQQGQQQHPRKPRDAADANKRRVLSDIFQSGSLEALEAVIVASAASFDHDHVAAAIARLVALSGDLLGSAASAGASAAGDDAAAAAPSRGPGPARREALGRARRLLSGLCAALLRFPDALAARQVCPALRALATLRPPGAEALVADLCGALAANDAALLANADRLEVVLVAWSLAKMLQQTPGAAAALRAGAAPGSQQASLAGAVAKVWPALARAAAARGGDMTAEEVASFSWALAVMGLDRDGRAAQALAPRAAALLPDMGARDVVHVAFAFAQHHARAVRARAGIAHKLSQQQQQQQFQADAGSGSGSGVDSVVGLSAAEAAQLASDDCGYVLDAAIEAARARLSTFQPHQLAALLASLRFAGKTDEHLLTAALPFMLEAVQRLGVAGAAAGPQQWNNAWQHLSQLAYGYTAPGHLGDFEVATDELLLGLGGGGGGGAGGAGGADGGIGGMGAVSDGEGDTDAHFEAAELEAAGAGAAAAPIDAVRREAVVAAAAACERLLQRAEERWQRGGASAAAPGGGFVVAQPGMPTPPPAAALPPRRRLFVKPRRALPIVRAAVLVAPSAAAPLARAIAEYVLRAGQLPGTPARMLSIMLTTLPAAGLGAAGAANGELYPALLSAVAAKLPEMRPLHQAWVAGALRRLNPPPVGMLRAMAPLVREAAPAMHRAHVAYAAQAYARGLAWERTRRAPDVGGYCFGDAACEGGGSGSGEDGGGAGVAAVPNHWTWDTRQAPSPDAASWGGSPSLGPLADEAPGVAAALARRAGELGLGMLERALPEDDGAGAGGGDATPAALRQRHVVDFVVALRLVRAGDAALYARLLAPALREGGSLRSLDADGAARLLCAMGDAAAAGAAADSSSSGGGSSGSGDGSSVAEVVGALAERFAADAAGLARMPASRLAAVRRAAGALEAAGAAAGGEAAQALNAAVDGALAGR